MNTSTKIPCARSASTRNPAGSLCRFLTIIALVALPALITNAQTSSANAPLAGPGAIAGQALDATSARYLEGADITVQNNGAIIAQTTSVRGGGFRLANVPAGTYSLTVAYPGLDAKTINVTVNNGQTADTGVINLGGDIVQLEKITVSSAKEGMAEAQALQKMSVQYKIVAANDQFGPVMEGNVGEYLKFLPGVNIDYNVNDARGVSLRGLSTAFTIVAVDGTPMAGGSSTDDTRRFEFEQIAMNNVANTEIFKTVTPDIPASATGGYVNFVTKSAFDHSEPILFNYDLSFSAPSTRVALTKQDSVWGQKPQFTIRPSAEINFAQQVTKKLGYNLNYRFSEKYDSSPRTEYTWNTTKVGGTANSIFSGAPLLQQYNIRDEEKLTQRQAFATKLDYTFCESTKLVFGGQWNWYDLHFTQRGPQFNLGTGTGATRTNDTFIGAAGAQIQDNTLQRRKYGTTWDFNATLSHDFANKSQLSITPYWSYANSQYRDVSEGYISASAVMASNQSATTPANSYYKYTLDHVFDLGTLATIGLWDSTGAAIPLDRMRNLSNYNLSNSTGTNFQSREWTAKDTKDGINGFYKLPLPISMPLTLQVGGALDYVHRTIDRPDLRGNIPNTTGATLASLLDTSFTNDVAYGFGPIQALDPQKTWSMFSNKLTYINGYDKRNIKEQNQAGYLRADLTPIKDLIITGGVRYEHRTIDATARTGSPTNNRIQQSTANLDYASWYPSLTAKYTPIKKIVLRAGYARTVGHPDYGEILPSFTTPSTPGGSDGTINAPSPNIKPYFVDNYDISLDYYIKNSGVVGISVYRKDVSNFIISRSMTTAERDTLLKEYGFNPADFGTTAGTIKQNGSKSRLQGVEIYWQQNLSFLPKPLNGLNFQVNFTYLDIHAYDSDPYRALDTWYSQNRAVSPKTANFVLGYRYGKLNTLLTLNWKSESLYGGFVNTNYFTGNANTTTPSLDTRLAYWKDEKTTVDWKIEYAISRHFSAYFMVRNLFNKPNKEFLKGYLPQNQSTVLPYRYFEFGEPHLTLGVRGTF